MSLQKIDKRTALGQMYECHDELEKRGNSDDCKAVGAKAILAMIACTERDCEAYLTCSYVLMDAFLRYFWLSSSCAEVMPCDLGDKEPFPVTAEYVLKMIVSAKNRCDSENEKAQFGEQIAALERDFKKTAAYQQWQKKQTPPSGNS